MPIFLRIFEIITDIVTDLVMGIVSVFYNANYGYFGEQSDFFERPVNISLFSETPIFTTNMADLLLFITTTIFVVFILRLLWKGTKKFINMIFGVFRV